MKVPVSARFAIVCGLMLFFSLSGRAAETNPVAGNETSGLFFTENNADDPLPLGGEWEYYPERFLDPLRSPEEQGAVPLRLRLPQKLTAPYWGTLRLRVVLPTAFRGVSLALASQEQNSAARYHVNGRLLLVLGNAASSSDRSHPAFHRLRADFIPDGPEITILIHFSNFEIYNGYFSAPQLGTSAAVAAQLRKADIIQSLVTGALVMMLVYHLFLFLIRRDRSPLYFSIFIVSVIVRLLLTQGYLYGFFPAHSIPLMKLEYVMFFIMPFFFCLYLRSLGLMRFEKTVFRAMLFVMLLAAGLTVFLPLAHASDSVLSFYQYYTLVVIVCLVRELVRATRRKHEDIWLFNFGTLLLAVSSINDILHFLRVIETGPISHFGLVVFIMFQSAILARRYSRLFFQYEHLNRNLGQLVEKKTEEMNLTIQALEHASVSDSLTGVRNRRYVYEILFPEAQALLQRWEFTEKFFGVLMLDIDHFKNINDTHGHEAGDRILKQFSSILTDCVRVDDLVVRWGGEEFLVILRDLKPVLLPDLANKIIRQVRSVEFRIADDDRHRLRMTASLGCCLFPFFSRRAEMISLAECIRIADLALYMAKRHGRDRGIMAEAGLQAAELADLSLLDGPEEGLAGKIIFRDGEHSPPV